MNLLIARIIMRYIAGFVAGGAGFDAYLTSPDVVNIVAMVLSGFVALFTEWVYSIAKAKGLET